jgi:anthranilate synthase component I
VDDPLSVPVDMSRSWHAAPVDELPDVFTGGWVGYTGYDTVRYTYPKKIGFEGAPEDDRNLLDMHLGLYKDAVVFDNATKLAYVVSWAEVAEGADVEAAWAAAVEQARGS